MYFLQNWDRLLPSEGIIIFPNILYKDVNDISLEEREITRKFFKYNPTYLTHTTSININKGSQIDRKYCIYAYKDDICIGCILSQEILDNPDGYGKYDFENIKLVYPEYRQTKYVRYLMSDFLHLMFKSGIAKYLYAYVPIKSSASLFFYDIIDMNKMPCIGKRYISDTPDVQKYISINHPFKYNDNHFAILEFNGEIYNSMDLVTYMSAVPNRSLETIKRWIKEMDNAAKQVKKLQNA